MKAIPLLYQFCYRCKQVLKHVLVLVLNLVLVLKILKQAQIGRILLPFCDLPDFPYLACGSWHSENSWHSEKSRLLVLNLVSVHMSDENQNNIHV